MPMFHSPCRWWELPNLRLLFQAGPQSVQQDCINTFFQGGQQSVPDHLPRRDAGTVTARLRVSTPVEHTTQSEVPKYPGRAHYRVRSTSVEDSIEVPRYSKVWQCGLDASQYSMVAPQHSTVWQYLGNEQYGSSCKVSNYLT